MDDCACWQCRHPEATQEEYDALLLHQIDEHGWVVQAVLGDRTHPPFSYTVGLTRYRLPELVLTGRRCEVAGPLLDHAAGHAGLYGLCLRAVQLVWADDRGRWPWQVGHRAGSGGQPVLGPRTTRSGGLAQQQPGR